MFPVRSQGKTMTMTKLNWATGMEPIKSLSPASFCQQRLGKKAFYKDFLNSVSVFVISRNRWTIDGIFWVFLKYAFRLEKKKGYIPGNNR